MKVRGFPTVSLLLRRYVSTTTRTIFPQVSLDPFASDTAAEACQRNAQLRNSEVDVSRGRALYEQHRRLNKELQMARSERNRLAKLRQSDADLRARLDALETDHRAVHHSLLAEARRVPNATHPSVCGLTEPRLIAESAALASAPSADVTRAHARAEHRWDVFDLEAGARCTGSKFAYLRNELALLELALELWALGRVSERHGFTPMAVPDLAQLAVVEACGFAPRGAQSATYAVEHSSMALAATAEVALAGYLANCRVPVGRLPLRLAAHSHCFRSEAKSASGTGLYRLHQFSKVEMFVVCAPSDGESMLEELVAIQRELFDELGLPYRVLDMPPDDLGAPAYRKYDIEAWMPGAGIFGEISSASNCTDFQSRRLNLRLEKSDGSLLREFPYTLNGTALAVPRILVAILENFADPISGVVSVPSCLHPFLPPFAREIRPKSDVWSPNPMLGTFYLDCEV